MAEAMFTEDEARRLKKICEGLKNPVEFTLFQTHESEFGRRLESFVDGIVRLSQGKIRRISGSADPVLPAHPCFKIGGKGHSNIMYAAVPTGHQFTPFIRALELIGRNYSSVPGDKPAEAGLHAEFHVLVSEHCPRCPAAVEAAMLLANRHPSISACVMDAGQFPHFVQQYGIKSVPATILDRRLVLIGNVSADRLMELVETRGTLKFEMEVVQSLIETGRIAEAAACIVNEAGREVILALMQDLDFSKRLSALVVVEKALDDTPDAVRSLVPSIVMMLSHTDSRIRGDVADLLGKIGDPLAIPQLERLLADPDSDVAEAAAEAIAELHKQQS